MIQPEIFFHIIIAIVVVFVFRKGHDLDLAVKSHHRRSASAWMMDRKILFAPIAVSLEARGQGLLFRRTLIGAALAPGTMFLLQGKRWRWFVIIAIIVGGQRREENGHVFVLGKVLIETAFATIWRWLLDDVIKDTSPWNRAVGHHFVSFWNDRGRRSVAIIVAALGGWILLNQRRTW